MQAYEQALAAVSVPFLVRGAERFFERPEVRQAVTLLRAAARSSSADDCPAGQVRPILAGLGLTPQPARGPGHRTRPVGVPGGRSPSSPAIFLRRRAGTPRSADLAAELALRGASGQIPALEGVTLGSLHAAKGLEWDVGVPGRADRRHAADHLRAKRRGIAEERRLLYVGITRARERAVPVHGRWPGHQRRRARRPIQVPGRHPSAGAPCANPSRYGAVPVRP